MVKLRQKVKSHALLFSDFEKSWYGHWARLLRQYGNGLNGYRPRANKFWQNAIIAEKLSELGLLRDGCSGIGFGVGKERLPALFASMGVHITATDQDHTTTKARLWKAEELANGLDALNALGICDQALFEKNTTFRAVDMSKIPRKYFNRFDFVWSNCALGHLGSVDLGLEFIIKSARCLKDGGAAVHTTEINVISDEITVDKGETVLFRPKDLYRLSLQLLEEGFILDPPRFTFGSSRSDSKITFKPRFGNDYSKLLVGGHIASQILLVVRKPKTNRQLMRQYYKLLHFFRYKMNLREQKRFSQHNKTIRAMLDASTRYVKPQDIRPIKRSMTLNLRDTTYVYIEYKNVSSSPLFCAHARYYSSNPIVLATRRPTDRKSVFFADDWLNGQPTRPSSYIYKKNKDGTWQEIDYVAPRSNFAFRVKLDGRRCMQNKIYKEAFGIVQEGVAHLDNTTVTIRIKT